MESWVRYSGNPFWRAVSCTVGVSYVSHAIDYAHKVGGGVRPGRHAAGHSQEVYNDVYRMRARHDKLETVSNK